MGVEGRGTGGPARGGGVVRMMVYRCLCYAVAVPRGVTAATIFSAPRPSSEVLATLRYKCGLAWRELPPTPALAENEPEAAATAAAATFIRSEEEDEHCVSVLIYSAFFIKSLHFINLS